MMWGRQVRGAWSVWRAIERKQPTAFEDAIDDGRGEVVIMEDPPPGIERFVRGEIIARFLRWRSLTTWKSMLAASVPYVR